MNKNKKARLYKKDDLLTVEITDIGNDGEGIGKIDGYTLFIKDAVIGDKVKTKIMKAKKNYAYAHLEEVITPSKDRVKPRCPIARQCGGCQIQNMSYESQLRFKQSKVRNNIVRLGGFDEKEIDSIMEPIIGMDDPFKYRNKAQFPVGKDKNGKVVTGFYAGHSHNIIPNTDCIIGVPDNKEILEIIIAHMEKNHIEPYDEVTGKGLVRHILIRKGFVSGQLMVCLVINYKNKNNTESIYIKNQDELISKLSSIDGMTSISVSINIEKTNVIMGTEIHTIWGQDTIKDTLCGLEFNISPLSFYQVNPVQTEKLYGQAIEYAGLTGNETVWDLYCGIGTITLSMSKKAKQVYGVEIIPQAIDDANDNAARNNISNAKFYVGKAEEVLPDFYEKESEKDSSSNALHPDVIVVDPPRKGCDQMCLDTMLKMAPNRIVYVSCDSATLARDLRILCDGGYKLEHVRPCDMFPMSVHVETVCLLSKKM
ncbi:23S rRNA (uracil(1939)-C(5))-methyltransferase RlmD [Butyrivibrio fibrisolvens]|uniref:23S rRNA (Uracil(1939)-C(5))-methyltransferase RlmD n=1 Tax=Butyrivibrio fibrisolvens TaxID=831 RepID=A0A317FXG9_BUTFI|nr:23S rRNA (uracil(1939)-C(5))-methyltransferase RlmD [Butyrivibrio fibrisolvens]PWT26395.1 23S rRNA (uracil(1939)-C(5))-methyltransferase RlmD [Butyrivibrio fibrisolvens]